ncbi:MAG: hypothetical protein U0165_07445 [Polyangiaceae bacterium]
MSRLSLVVLVAMLSACAAGAPPTSAGDELDDTDASVQGGTSGSSGSAGSPYDSSIPEAGYFPDSGTAASGGTAGSAGNAGAGGTAGSSGSAGAAGSGGTSSSECTPGQAEEVGACAMCGTLVRTCTDASTWGSPVCTAQGECEVGQSEDAPCGNCGSKTRSCSSTCTWEAFSPCGGEGVCAPGSTGADCLCSSNSSGTTDRVLRSANLHRHLRMVARPEERRGMLVGGRHQLRVLRRRPMALLQRLLPLV